MSDSERAALWACFPDPVKKFAGQYMVYANLAIVAQDRDGAGDPDLLQFRKTGLEIVYKGKAQQGDTELRLGIKLGNGKLKLLVTMRHQDKEVTQEDVIQTLNDKDFPKEAKRWADQLSPFLWTGEF